ncbi:MAG: hypothetical protein GF317_14300 [Candidatus Lokiarchaeota archaeon]|nr:hypothetical protein [Candidatus Lokiarchaeota archaeon]
MENIDIVCSCCWTPTPLFKKNLKSWIKEFPVNHIYLGFGRPELEVPLEEIRTSYTDDKITLINQTEYITSGKAFIDLMKLTQTKWFLFIHDDVRPTPYLFTILRRYITEKVGIIESEHLHWNSFKQISNYYIPKYKYYNFNLHKRAFSGLQLIRKAAISSLFNKIEDDYMMRNEDFIIQYECIKNGYSYEKTWGFHFHQRYKNRPRPRLEIYEEWQWKGLIKYTNPIYDTLIRECLGSIHYNKRKKNITIKEILDFCKLHNPAWIEVVLQFYDNSALLHSLEK